MRNNLFIASIILAIAISKPAVAQSINERKIDIQNTALVNKITEYQTYVKKFALDHKILKYLITLKCESYKDYTTITLNVAYYKSDISAFNPSKFAVIDGTAIIMHDGLDDFVNKDHKFIKYLEDNYWDDGMKNIEPAPARKPDTMPDSIMIRGKMTWVGKGTVVESSEIRGNSYPKACILTFKGKLLVSEAMDKFDRQTQ